MKSWRGWQTSLRPAFKRDRCLADFFNFDHRFEALVGCACSRIVRGGKKITTARSEDGVMKWNGEEKKRQRKGNGEGWREEMKGRGRKNKMRERKRETERLWGGKKIKDQDLSWDCWQFSKRIPILTTAAQQDVEMAGPALYLNLCWL